MVWVVVWLTIGLIVVSLPMILGDESILENHNDDLSNLMLVAFFWPALLLLLAVAGVGYCIRQAFFIPYAWITRRMARFWKARKDN